MRSSVESGFLSAPRNNKAPLSDSTRQAMCKTIVRHPTLSQSGISGYLRERLVLHIHPAVTKALLSHKWKSSEEHRLLLPPDTNEVTTFSPLDWYWRGLLH